MSSENLAEVSLTAICNAISRASERVALRFSTVTRKVTLLATHHEEHRI